MIRTLSSVPELAPANEQAGKGRSAKARPEDLDDTRMFSQLLSEPSGGEAEDALPQREARPGRLQALLNGADVTTLPKKIVASPHTRFEAGHANQSVESGLEKSIDLAGNKAHLQIPVSTVEDTSRITPSNNILPSGEVAVLTGAVGRNNTSILQSEDNAGSQNTASTSDEAIRTRDDDQDDPFNVSEHPVPYADPATAAMRRPEFAAVETTSPVAPAERHGVQATVPFVARQAISEATAGVDQPAKISSNATTGHVSVHSQVASLATRSVQAGHSHQRSEPQGWISVDLTEATAGRSFDVSSDNVALAASGNSAVRSIQVDLRSAPGHDQPAGPADQDVTIDTVKQETHVAPTTMPNGGNVRVFDQVVSGLIASGDITRAPTQHRLQAGPDGAALTLPLKVLQIQLQPRELGDVAVRIAMRGDKIELRIQSARPATVDLLKNDQRKLAEALRRENLDVEAMTVQLVEPERNTGGSPLIPTNSGAVKSQSDAWYPSGSQGEAHRHNGDANKRDERSKNEPNQDLWERDWSRPSSGSGNLIL